MDVRPGLEAAQVYIQALCVGFGWVCVCSACAGEGLKYLLHTGRTWYSVDLRLAAAVMMDRRGF